MGEDNGSDHDGEEGSLPLESREQPAPTAEDVAVSQAKRAATTARIRTI
jgi:hypothetical protein